MVTASRPASVFPTEENEMLALAQWLDLHRLLWMHPANEGLRSIVAGRRLKARGLKAGVPDVFVFTEPPKHPCRGVAIELKRRQGGVVTSEQRQWLANLEGAGWVAFVAFGAGAAIEQLEQLGYGKREMR